MAHTAAHTHTYTTPQHSCSLTFQRPHKFYKLPQFCFHLKFPNLVVIKPLSESLWMLAKLLTTRIPP